MLAVVVVAVVALLAALVLVLAYRRGRLLGVSLGLLAASSTAFVLALVAIDRDYRDADGIVDCWPNCTAFQETVRMAVVGSPPVFLLALAALWLGAWAQRRRG